MKQLLLKTAISLGISLPCAYAIYWYNFRDFKPSFTNAFFVETMVFLLLGLLLIFMPPYRPRRDAPSYEVIVRRDMNSELAPWEDAGPEKRDRQIGAVLTLTGLFMLAIYAYHDPSCFSELLRWLGITAI